MKLKDIGSVAIAAAVVAGCFVKRKIDEAKEKKDLQLTEEKTYNVGISTLPLGVEIKPSSYKKGILEINIQNFSGYTIPYVREFTMEKLVDGEWVEMQKAETEEDSKMPVVNMKDLTSLDDYLDLSVYGKIMSGKYRIKLSGIFFEFELV